MVTLAITPILNYLEKSNIPSERSVGEEEIRGLPFGTVRREGAVIRALARLHLLVTCPIKLHEEVRASGGQVRI